MRILPHVINDGTYIYVQVRAYRLLDNGTEEVALYEREPKDMFHQYTPCLAYCQGLTTTPGMIPITR